MFDLGRGDEELVASIASGDDESIQYASVIFNEEEIIAARMVAMATLLWEYQLPPELLKKVSTQLPSKSVLPFTVVFRQLSQNFFAIIQILRFFQFMYKFM